MTTPLSALSGVQTLPQLLAFRAARTPDAPAYRAFDGASQAWVRLTWAQARARVARWSQALAAMALPSGTRVAILLPNGLDALTTDQAALALGHVPVPLHTTDTPASLAAILADCAASLLVVEEWAQWERIRALGLPLSDLLAVLVTGAGAASDPGAPVPVVALADWLAGAKARGRLYTPPCAADLAAIVYPAGNTGPPKGAMLTHRNVLSCAKACLARLAPRLDDVFLSSLPLAHAFERTAGYYLPMAAGSCVAYARSAALLAEDLQTVRPTVLVSLPQMYEHFHAQLLQTLAPSPWRRQLLEAAQAQGWRRFCTVWRLPPPPATEAGGWMRALPWPLLQALVAQPLRAHFGGRVRMAVSSGAALPPAMAQCFLGLGLPLVQGYGMAEAAPVVSANTLRDNDPRTVGRALADMELRIGDHRELQVRGPTVMKGYWNRPEETARVLDTEGWLRTGEQAEIVHGRIRLLGRMEHYQ